MKEFAHFGTFNKSTYIREHISKNLEDLNFSLTLYRIWNGGNLKVEIKNLWKRFVLRLRNDCQAASLLSQLLHPKKKSFISFLPSSAHLVCTAVHIPNSNKPLHINVITTPLCGNAIIDQNNCQPCSPEPASSDDEGWCKNQADPDLKQIMIDCVLTYM